MLAFKLCFVVKIVKGGDCLREFFRSQSVYWEHGCSRCGEFGVFNEAPRSKKIDTTANVEECVLEVAALAGHENVLSASRMNNAIVIFLKTIDLTNLVAESGIEIRGIFYISASLFYPFKESQAIKCAAVYQK